MAIPPVQNNPPEPEQDISVNRLIVVGIITRLVTDTAVQFFFPFLPVIAEGLRTSTVIAGRLVSLRSAMGLLSPVFGYQAYLRGYRTVMRFGLLLAAVGYLIVGLSNSIWLAAIGMVLSGLGTFSFVPILQAYLSAKLPFHRRARGLGMLEYSWALAGIMGLYLVGLLIDATNWRVPLFVMSGLLVVAFVGYGRLPGTNKTQKPPTEPTRFTWRAVTNFFELGANKRSAYAVLLIIGLNMMAAMNVFLNYGTWLDREYALDPIQLGTVALILGVADLGGSVLMSLVGDKFGLRRSVVVGTLLTGIGYAVLPISNQGVVLAVVGLIVVRFTFEYTVVALIALVSEQAPAYRGKIMTLAAATALLGSSLAGLFGPWVYDHFQVVGLSVISTIVMGVCLIGLRIFVRERGE